MNTKSSYLRAMLVMAIVYLSSAARADWREYAGNPVLTKGHGVAGLQILQPCVVKDGDTYRMWYAGYWGTREIATATSKDGVHWQMYNGGAAVLSRSQGEGDGWTVLGRPCVIKDGDVYKVWYMGSLGWTKPNSIGYATSRNGINWDKYSGNPVLAPAADAPTSGSVSSPCVIKDGDGYKMWYIGVAAGDWVQKVFYATSADGIKWVAKPAPVLIGDAPWECNRVVSVWVLKDKTTYRMWYGVAGQGNQAQIGEATSSDGIAWRKSGTPALTGSDPSVLRTDEEYKMWYGIGKGESIGYASSTVVPETPATGPGAAVPAVTDFAPIAQGPNSPFGINCLTFPEMEGKVGVKWIRMQFAWGEVEPKKGEFDWRRMDALMKSAKENKIHVMGLLTGTAAWASTAPPGQAAYHAYPPAKLSDYAAYVQAVVSRYKDDVHYWEIWNEPDLAFSWRSGPIKFTELLKTAYGAAKQADPQCKVVAMALSSGFHSFLKGVLDSGGGSYFDIYSDHIYAAEESAKARLVQIRALFRQYGLSKPIWITETGYNSHIEPRAGESREEENVRWEQQLKTQADYVVKEYVGFMAEGVERTFLYQASRVGSRYAHENYGLLDEKGQPLPAAFAYHTMVRKLSGTTYLAELKYGRDIVAHVFLKGQEPVVCLWGTQDEQIQLNAGSPAIRVTDVSGREREISTGGAPVTLACGTSPLFVEGMNAKLLLLKKELVFSPVTLELTAGQERQVSLQMTNPFPEDLTIALSAYATPGCSARIDSKTLTIKGGRSVKSTLGVRLADTAATGEYKVMVSGELGNGLGKVENSLDVRSRPTLDLVVTPTSVDESGTMHCDLTVTNWASVPASGTVSIEPDFDAQVTPRSAAFEKLPPEQSAKFPFLLSSAPSVTNLNKITLVGRSAAGPVVKHDISMDFAPCRRIATVPGFNGDLKPYGAMTFVNLCRSEQFVRFVVTSEEGNWHGVDDLSARVWTAWDEQYFYLAAAVRDDVHYQPYEIRAPVWEGDSIQLALDTLCNRSINYDDDDYEIALALTSKGPEFAIFAAPMGGAGLMKELKLATTKTTQGLVYELRIPWRAIGIKPVAGKRIGFSLLVNDNDGKGRKALQWTTGIARGKDPSKFGQLILVEGK